MRIPMRCSVLIVLIASSGAFFGFVASAEAQPYGYNAEPGIYWPDNASHAYHYDFTLGSNGFYANEQAIYRLETQTDMTTVRDVNKSAYTDIIFYDSPYGGSTLGYWQCTKLKTSTTCEQGKSVLNNSTYTTYNVWERVACQELGHSVALGHSENNYSCMYQSSGLARANHFDTHDRSHVNGALRGGW